MDLLSEELAGEIPDKWLASQFVAIGYVDGDAVFPDVMDENLLAEMNLRAPIRKVLVDNPLAFGGDPRLDFGSIQSSGTAARRLTQALSREIHEAPEDLTGIRYISRHTEDEECWAVFDDRTTVTFDPDRVSPLNALNADHTAAARSAAQLLRLTLPPSWREDP